MASLWVGRGRAFSSVAANVSRFRQRVQPTLAVENIGYQAWTDAFLTFHQRIDARVAPLNPMSQCGLDIPHIRHGAAWLADIERGDANLAHRINNPENLVFVARKLRESAGRARVVDEALVSFVDIWSLDVHQRALPPGLRGHLRTFVRNLDAPNFASLLDHLGWHRDELARTHKSTSHEVRAPHITALVLLTSMGWTTREWSVMVQELVTASQPPICTSLPSVVTVPMRPLVDREYADALMHTVLHASTLPVDEKC